MRIPVKIKIEKENQRNTISEYSAPFDIETTTKVSEIKSLIKQTIPLKFEVATESIYLRNKVLKDDDVITEEDNLQYNLKIK